MRSTLSATGRTWGSWIALPSTIRMFRDDRLLLAATVLLALSALLPVFATPILPLVDLGSNIGAASLLDDAASGKGFIAHHYAINHSLIPYWTVYLLIAGLEQFVSPLIAAKVVVGIAVVLLPVSSMRLLLALGRSPRLGLWAFMLCWDNNLYWGWITFQYGMVLALIALAKLLEMRSLRDALKLLPLTVLIALTHLNAVALVLAAGGLFALARPRMWSGLGLQALALSGCIIPILPWIQSKLANSTVTAAVPFVFDTHELAHKLMQLFTYSLDVLPGEWRWAAALSFGLLLLGGSAFTLLPQRAPTNEQRWASLLFLLTCAGLYFGLPFAVGGALNHWYTYPRYSSYILLALLTLPRPRLRGLEALSLLPGIVAALLLHHGIEKQFRAYGEYVTPYLSIIESIPRNSRLLPLDLDDYRFRGTREASLGQLHGYAAAMTSSYDPHLFDEINNPLHFRKEHMLPFPHWQRPNTFNLERHGLYYDYVIVHPADRDPIEPRARSRAQVKLVREAGPWRLYKVNRPKPLRRK